MAVTILGRDTFTDSDGTELTAHTPTDDGSPGISSWVDNIGPDAARILSNQVRGRGTPAGPIDSVSGGDVAGDNFDLYMLVHRQDDTTSNDEVFRLIARCTQQIGGGGHTEGIRVAAISDATTPALLDLEIFNVNGGTAISQGTVVNFNGLTTVGVDTALNTTFWLGLTVRGPLVSVFISPAANAFNRRFIPGLVDIDFTGLSAETGPTGSQGVGFGIAHGVAGGATDDILLDTFTVSRGAPAVPTRSAVERMYAGQTGNIAIFEKRSELWYLTERVFGAESNIGTQALLSTETYDFAPLDFVGKLQLSRLILPFAHTGSCTIRGTGILDFNRVIQPTTQGYAQPVTRRRDALEIPIHQPCTWFRLRVEVLANTGRLEFFRPGAGMVALRESTAPIVGVD